MAKPENHHSPQVAVGAVVSKDGKILLVRRMNPPHKDKWSIPGGSVNLGETLQEAAEREVKEETGLIIRAAKPIHTFDLIERDEAGTILFHYVIVDLEAQYVSGKLQPSDDALDAGWFSKEELEHLAMTPGTRAFLMSVRFIV